MNQKGFSQGLVVIIVVGVIAAGAFIFYYSQKAPEVGTPGEPMEQATSTGLIESPTTSSTSSSASVAQKTPSAQGLAWKTFKDKVFGFEFSYPPELKVYFLNSSSSILDPRGGALFLNTSPPALPTYEHRPFISVIVRPVKNPEQYPNGSATRAELTRLTQDYKDYFEITYSTISAAGYVLEKGVMVSLKESLPEVTKGQKTFSVFIARNGVLYQFSSVEDKKRGVTETLFDKIISSIKFSN